jgi:hypothetical protein
MLMKVSREARNKYQLKEFEFSDNGDIIFDGDIYSVRLFTQLLNQKRDLINYPEMAIKIGQFNGMALIFEIDNYLIDQYSEKTKNSSLYEDLYDYLTKKIGQEELLDTTK